MALDLSGNKNIPYQSVINLKAKVERNIFGPPKEDIETLLSVFDKVSKAFPE